MRYVKLPRPVYVCNCGDHVWTACTKGYVTLVSPEDASFIEDRAWCTSFINPKRKRKRVYARASGSRLLHREILQVGPEVQIDHEDGNGLDNRRKNIRPATNQQNARNCSNHADGTSRFKGVSWHKPNKVWRCRIQVDGKIVSLGCFRDETSAALAYDAAALKHFGPYARLNFPDHLA